MSADSMGQKTDGTVSDRVSHSALTTNYKHLAKYGDDAAWPNVVWTIIGILSASGLAVFLLVQ